MTKHLRDAKLIGISGVINAGKDTVANLLLAKRTDSLRRYSFATPLKRGACAMFGWEMSDIEDRTFKEAIDPRWGFSPRKAMQLLGTEYGRNLLRDDIWVHAARNFHEDSLQMHRGTMITDTRFENEAEWIRSMADSVIIHVIDPTHDYQAPIKHISEQGVSMIGGDIVIYNDKTLGFNSLNEKLDEVW